MFYGENSFGKPQELIQHINQLDFLLSAQPKESTYVY
nr:MAG TPA: hypothetical protein [Caudoviricetes sp.]